MNGTVHGDDILRWHVRLDEVARPQNETSACAKCAHAANSLVFHFLHCAKRQRRLRIDASVESEPVTEVTFERAQFHPGTSPLDRVQQVDAARGSAGLVAWVEKRRRGLA